MRPEGTFVTVVLAMGGVGVVLDADGFLLATIRPALSCAGKILDLLGPPVDLSQPGEVGRYFDAGASDRAPQSF